MASEIFAPSAWFGIRLRPYQRLSEVPYTALGVHAIRAALGDAGLASSDVRSAYTGTATTAMGMSRLMYRHLGSTGIPMAQVENASASGSSAFRQACFEVAAGLVDVAIAVGVDKPLHVSRPQRAAGVHDLPGSHVVPFTHFALLAERYMHDHEATPEQFARVAVKNSANGSMNPNAQRQKARTLEEVMNAPRISGPLTRLQCCPIGEGAAAVVVASDQAQLSGLASNITEPSTSWPLPLARKLSMRVENFDAALTRETAAQALVEAKLTSADLDIVELHDAFTVEELLYAEAIGITSPGGAAKDLEEGHFDIGGRVAISPSGGLLAMGHPIGPTGVPQQICEITAQLRGEAGKRQHPGARTGLAHMVGVGAICVVHVLASS